MNLGLMMGLAGGLGEAGRFFEDRRKYLTEEEREAEEKRRWEAKMRQDTDQFSQNMGLQRDIHTQAKTSQDRQFGLQQQEFTANEAARRAQMRREAGRDILTGLSRQGIEGSDPMAILDAVEKSKAINLAGSTFMPGHRAPTLDDMVRQGAGVRAGLPANSQRTYGFIPGSEKFGGLSAVREPFAPNSSSSVSEFLGLQRMMVNDRQWAHEQADKEAQKVFQREMDAVTQLTGKVNQAELDRRKMRAESLFNTAYRRQLENFDDQFSRMYPGWVSLIKENRGPQRPSPRDVIPSGAPAASVPAVRGDTASRTPPLRQRMRSAVTTSNPLSDIP